jgi:large subunit ribosomal protein L18
MKAIKKKRALLQRRHQRLRQELSGTGERPRLAVYRSLRHLHVQIIDDQKGETLLSFSTNSAEFAKYGGNVAAAKEAGLLVAGKAKEKSITTVVFDRGGRKFHGRLKAFADAAREGGLTF